MNKHELRSAYNKIALSDEFKASAKEKLLASYDDNTSADESVQELHTAKEVKLSPQPKKPWKIAAGACAAAAAVGLGVWGVSTVIGKDVPIATQSEGAASITQEDIDKAISLVESEDFKILDTAVCDIDFDEQNELLVLQTWGIPEIRVFEKENGELTEGARFGFGKLNYIDKLELYPFEEDGESYYYFSFAFDNGGVMKANVLASITHGDSYEVEYLLSHGTLSYTDIPEPYIADFYRIGWNQNDVAMVGNFNDITKDEYLELYRKYDYAPPIEKKFDDEYQATVDKNYGEVRRLLDYYRKDAMPWDDETTFYIEGFPEVQFIWDHENVKAVDASGNEEILFGGMPIWSVYLTDLNGDGLREICSGVSFGSGIVDDHVVAYDYAAKKLYELSDRGYNDYYLSYSGLAPLTLMVHERDYASGELTGYCGELKIDGDKLTFERGEDINTSEMKQYTLPMTIMTQSEQGGLTFPQDEEISAEVKFSLPASWDCSASTASYAYAKVFEIGGVWRAYEGINTDSYKTDYAYGATITVIEEKWGTKNDLYEYFIHTSTPIKYAPDGTYDVYRYVVESNGYYVNVSIMSDMGVSQETISRVLESVVITSKNDPGIFAYEICELAGEVFHIEEMNGGTHAASNEDIRTVQLRLAIPLDWEVEWSEYFSGKAYYDGKEVFEFARPTHDDEPIEPEMFKTDFVDGDKVTVHEEKWGTESDLFKYYIHRSVESKDADDGSFDEYIYIVSDGGFDIRLTFAADAGIAQEDIDVVLKSVRMTEMLRCLS